MGLRIRNKESCLFQAGFAQNSGSKCLGISAEDLQGSTAGRARMCAWCGGAHVRTRTPRARRSAAATASHCASAWARRSPAKGKACARALVRMYSTKSPLPSPLSRCRTHPRCRTPCTNNPRACAAAAAGPRPASRLQHHATRHKNGSRMELLFVEPTLLANLLMYVMVCAVCGLWKRIHAELWARGRAQAWGTLVPQSVV